MTGNKTRRSCILGLALTLVSPMISEALAAETAKPINLGVIFPLKNIIGKQGYQGASLAAEFVNADGGSTGGRRISLTPYDTNYSPVEGVAAVQRLLTQDDVKVIVGEISSTIALAVIPVVKSENALLMLSVPKHPDVTKSGYRGVFRLNTTTSMDAASFNKFLVQDVAPNKVAVLAENNDVGRLSLENMKALFGTKIVFSDIFSVTQSDFSSKASNVRGSGADLVCIAASNPEQSGNLLKSMADLGYTPKRCLLPGLLNNDLPKVAGAAAEGVFSEDIYAPTLDNPLNKRFVEGYRAKYNETPGKVELLGFESVWVVAQAMKVAGTATDTAKISDVLRAGEWDSPRGKVRFDGEGRPRAAACTGSRSVTGSLCSHCADRVLRIHMLDLVLQQVANGLSTGMIYALIALGLTLVFGVLHVINFAHGEFYMLGGLVSVLLVTQLGVPYLATLPLAALGVALIGAVVDRIAVRPLIAGADGGSLVLITTFAVAIVLHEGVLARIGPAPISMQGVAGVVTLGTVAMTGQRIFILAFGVCLVVVLEFMLRRTKFGRALRAIAQSAFAARVVGLNVERVQAVTFSIAAALAGLSGALIAPVVTFNAHMGQHAAINAFVIVVVGTMGNVSGALVCGLLLGVLEALSSIILPQEVASACIYALLLVTLMARPNGLFARPQ